MATKHAKGASTEETALKRSKKAGAKVQRKKKAAKKAGAKVQRKKKATKKRGAATQGKKSSTANARSEKAGTKAPRKKQPAQKERGATQVGKPRKKSPAAGGQQKPGTAVIQQPTSSKLPPFGQRKEVADVLAGLPEAMFSMIRTVVYEDWSRCIGRLDFPSPDALQLHQVAFLLILSSAEEALFEKRVVPVAARDVAERFSDEPDYEPFDPLPARSVSTLDLPGERGTEWSVAYDYSLGEDDDWSVVIDMDGWDVAGVAYVH